MPRLKEYKARRNDQLLTNIPRTEGRLGHFA